MPTFCCSQQRNEQLVTSRLIQQRAEMEMRNEEAVVKEMEEMRKKQRQKESILEDLVRPCVCVWLF